MRAALVLLALAPILFITLGLPQTPAENPAATLNFWCLACGSRGSADFLLNAALFLPLGAALRLAGFRTLVIVAASVLLSGAIETAQLWMPGRYTSLGDLVANGVGGGIGATLAGSGPLGLRRPPGIIRQSALTILVAAIWIGTVLAFRPSLPEREYYGQWTADLGRYDVYSGRVLEAAVGDQPAPSWRLASSIEARQSLLAGDTVTVTVEAGHPPARLAPIFSIYDDQQDEILILGAEGTTLVLRLRRRAADLRLEAPELRWPEAMGTVAPGDTVRLRAWRPSGRSPSSRTRLCLGAGAETSCSTPDLGRGWVLLLGQMVPAGAAVILDALWVAGLVGLALWWAPGRREGLVGLSVLLLVVGLSALL